MSSKEYPEIQEILSTKLGNFYYKAKLGKDPKPEDLIIKGAKGDYLSPGLGTLSFLIYFIREEYGINNNLPFNKLIICVNRLSQFNDAVVVRIMDKIMSLPLLIKSEKYRKQEYQKLGEIERQRYRRKKKKELDECRKAIKKMEELNPMFDENGYYRDLAEKRVKNLKPSETLLQLKRIHKEGLLYATREGQKSTKGLQSLRGFTLRVYELSREASNLPDNAIYNNIAKILDLLKIRTSKGSQYGHENIKDVIKRNIPKHSN